MVTMMVMMMTIIIIIVTMSVMIAMVVCVCVCVERIKKNLPFQTTLPPPNSCRWMAAARNVIVVVSQPRRRTSFSLALDRYVLLMHENEGKICFSFRGSPQYLVSELCVIENRLPVDRSGGYYVFVFFFLGITTIITYKKNFYRQFLYYFFPPFIVLRRWKSWFRIKKSPPTNNNTYYPWKNWSYKRFNVFISVERDVNVTNRL